MAKRVAFCVWSKTIADRSCWSKGVTARKSSSGRCQGAIVTAKKPITRRQPGEHGKKPAFVSKSFPRFLRGKAMPSKPISAKSEAAT